MSTSNRNGFSDHDQSISILQVRPSPKPGATVAYADVQVGAVTILGVAVVRNRSGGYFVSPPSRPGTSRGKFFQIVEVSEPVRTELFKLVLEHAREYTEADFPGEA